MYAKTTTYIQVYEIGIEVEQNRTHYKQTWGIIHDIMGWHIQCCHKTKEGGKYGNVLWMLNNPTDYHMSLSIWFIYSLLRQIHWRKQAKPVSMFIWLHYYCFKECELNLYLFLKGRCALIIITPAYVCVCPIHCTPT